MPESNANLPSQENATRRVLYVGADLMVQSRLAGLVERTGCQLCTQAWSAPPVSGSPAKGADLYVHPTHGTIALVLLDLAQIPPDSKAILQTWRATVSETTPLVAFAPHVKHDLLAAATAAGCSLVLTRGQCLEQAETWTRLL